MLHFSPLSLEPLSFPGNVEVALSGSVNATATVTGVLTGVVIISNLSASQLEAGDTQSANLSAVASISANQSEAGDTQTAFIIGDVISSITANQLEAGDTQVARIGDAARSCLSGYVTIQPLLSGDTSIKPLLSGNVGIS